jgi:hypothetical protein
VWNWKSVPSSLDFLLNQLNLVQNLRNAFLQDESEFVTDKQYFYMLCCITNFIFSIYQFQRKHNVDTYALWICDRRKVNCIH